MNKSLINTLKRPLAVSALTLATFAVSLPSHAEWSANANLTNNYIWRGLTQSINESAVQGGLDYAHESGFYAGTWASNVSYESDDAYSYEHDIYLGFSGGEDLSWDVGYLYYNYDSNAQYDFGEIYGSLGYGGFSATAYVLANTETEEGPGEDFGFGSTYYLSGDYAFEVGNGVEIGLHVGYHDGDFQKSFNGTSDSYFDYALSASKSGFTFAVTGTDLDEDGSFAVTPARDNDNLKFVISYGIDFEL
ncbi:MAG: hypothetical protein HOJ88_05115 [Proteobacteria bacterium]|nr:hypothetical protein [Pseudomonadota bacterium]